MNAMTINTPKHTSFGNALFTGTQQKVLSHLFGQPGRSFYANELINLTQAGSGAVQRQLKRLADSGLVTVQAIGNQKHYQANPTASIFAELCNIVQKTFGLALPLQAALAPLEDQIDAAFVYGSIAKQNDTAQSDIDLLILSETLAYGDLMAELAPVEQRLGRRINPTLYSRAALVSRVKEGSGFITRVLAQPKIWLKGGELDLPA